MKIIAVDPGYDRCGVAVVSREQGGAETLLSSDCIVTNRKESFESRLLVIVKEFRALIKKHEPEVCALEKLFFTSNQKTAMRVAEVRGALILAACEAGLAIHEFGPGEIKVAVTGDGRASKQQVMLMIPKLVHIEKDIKYDDEYDAIAVGLTAGAVLGGKSPQM